MPAKVLNMRFFGIAVTFATSPVTRRGHKQPCSRQYCVRWLATLENAGQARPMAPAADCSEGHAVSWAWSELGDSTG